MENNVETTRCENPTLYILMRTDLQSMNPGKAMAQSCHAANQFMKTMENRLSDDSSVSYIENLYMKWLAESDCGTFGTTIVLNAYNEEFIKKTVNDFIFNDNITDKVTAGTVVDTTYPLRDGMVTHLLPVLTCGWVFCDRNIFEGLQPLKELLLHD